MNREDIRLLDNSIDNLGNSFERKRNENNQHDIQMQRLALEQQMQQSNLTRNAAETEHIKGENQGKVTTYLADPADPESGMQFSGSTQQLQTILDAADKAGKPLKQFSQAPQKDFAATYKLGGATYAFHSQEGASNFEKAMSGKGIDVNDPKYSGANGGKKPAVSQALEDAQGYREKASASDDPDEAKQWNEYADYLESFAKKSGQFKPPTIPPNSDESYDYDAAGHKTGAHKTFTNPNTPPPVGMSFMHGAVPPLQPTADQFQQPSAAPDLIAPKPAMSNAVPPIAQRVVGQTYQTPKGSFQWTGTGWKPAQ